MAVQIANPQVIAKIERLCELTGLGKTATVEAALDLLLEARSSVETASPWAGVDGLIAQLHRLPTRPDAYDAVRYDEKGLPL